MTGNSVTGVGSNSAFSEADSCPAATTTAYNANQHLLWNSPLVTGPTSLQSGFVQHTDYPSFFICPTPPLPNSQVWTNGTLSVTVDPTTFSSLHNGFDFVYDNSGHLIVYENGVVQTTIGSTTTCNFLCTLNFQGDGNLVKRVNGSAFWQSATANRGSTLTAMNTSPWLQIKDKTGVVIWDGVNGVRLH